MTQFSTITPTMGRVLNDPRPAIAVHGSVYVHPYIIGTSRGDNRATPPDTGEIVRLHKDSYTPYSSLRVPAPNDGTYTNKPWATEFASCCYVGGFVWTWGLVRDNTNAARSMIVKIDPATFTIAGSWLFATHSAKCETVLSDGTFLYLAGDTKAYKWNMTTQTLAATLDITSTGAYSGVAFPPYSNFVTNGLHAGVYDGGFLYLANSALATEPKFLMKVRTSDMKVVGYSQIPQVTDDMDHNSTFCFLGVEEANTSNFGGTWGAVAVRKSDLAVFPLPKLGASDTSSTLSYASLVFGNYLVDVKTNKHVYVLDITNPALWSASLSGSALSSIIIHDATINTDLAMGGSQTTNELVVDNDGFLHSFVWDPSSPYISGIVKYSVPGLSLSVVPSVSTVAPTVDADANTATLRGDLTSSGGAAITEKGFYFGTVNPPTIKITVAGADTGTFSAPVNGLADGTTYYVRAFAKNSVGESLGTVQSFNVNPVPGKLTGTVFHNFGTIQGVTVRAWRWDTNAYAGASVTDAAGKYSFTGLTSGVQYLIVCHSNIGGEAFSAPAKVRTAP